MAKAKTKGPGLVGRSLRAYEEIPGRILHGVADAADAVLGTNPKRKRVTRRRAKKPPTAKQLAARAKFTAMVRARAKTNRSAHPATKTNRATKSGSRRSNRLRGPSKTNRSARARVKVKVSVNARSRKAPARSQRGNPGVVRMSESEARRYGGKIKGFSLGSERPQQRSSSPRRKSRKRAKRMGVFSGTGRFGLGRSRQHFRVNSTRTGIFEQFSGRDSRNVSKLIASDHVPLDVDKLGGLEEFIVKQQGQPLKRIRFNPANTALAASRGKSGRFKLHVLGPVKFNHRANPGELHDLGDIHKLVYVARKNHIDNRQVHYTHVLKAPYPMLCVDHEGRPVIADPLGGRKIDERGIID